MCALQEAGVLKEEVEMKELHEHALYAHTNNKDVWRQCMNSANGTCASGIPKKEDDQEIDLHHVQRYISKECPEVSYCLHCVAREAKKADAK